MKIYAHRGASDQYPENTMLAFKKAIEQGADGIETDVHLTKDNVLVLIHDETIDRTSNGQGWIKDYTYEELLQFDFSHHQSNIKQNIPRLEELLDLVKKSNIGLNIELKTDCIDYKGIEAKTVELVKQYDLLDSVIFSSFNIETLIHLMKIEPNAKTGYLFERNFADQLMKAKHYHIRYLHPRHTLLLDKVVKLSNENGFLLNVWTVNHIDEIKKMKDFGVTICITNCVSLAKSIGE